MKAHKENHHSKKTKPALQPLSELPNKKKRNLVTSNKSINKNKCHMYDITLTKRYGRIQIGIPKSDNYELENSVFLINLFMINI